MMISHPIPDLFAPEFSLPAVVPRERSGRAEGPMQAVGTSITNDVSNGTFILGQHLDQEAALWPVPRKDCPL